MGYSRNPIRTRPQDPARRKWAPSEVIRTTSVQPCTCCVCDREIPAGTEFLYRTWTLLSSHASCGDPVARPYTPPPPDPCAEDDAPWCGRDCTACSFQGRGPNGGG